MGQQNRVIISLKQSLLYSWGQNKNRGLLKLIKQEQDARNTNLYQELLGSGGWEAVKLCGKRQIKTTKSYLTENKPHCWSLDTLNALSHNHLSDSTARLTRIEISHEGELWNKTHVSDQLLSAPPSPVREEDQDGAGIWPTCLCVKYGCEMTWCSMCV